MKKLDAIDEINCTRARYEAGRRLAETCARVCDRYLAGPILVVANLDQQLGYVCRSGVLIGWTTISTGMEGYDTPTGVFHTLQKDK